MGKAMVTDGTEGGRRSIDDALLRTVALAVHSLYPRRYCHRCLAVRLGLDAMDISATAQRLVDRQPERFVLSPQQCEHCGDTGDVLASIPR